MDKKFLAAQKKINNRGIQTYFKIRNVAEGTGDLIRNKVVEKIIGIDSKEAATKPDNTWKNTDGYTKRRYTSPERRQPIIDEL